MFESGEVKSTFSEISVSSWTVTQSAARSGKCSQFGALKRRTFANLQVG